MTLQPQYHHLGQSGLRVSVPIIGGMSFGNPVWSSWILPESKALAILKAAWDCGINTIDTANMYSNGESEKIVDKFLKAVALIYNIPWHNFVIVTKARFIITHNDPSAMSGWGKPQLMNKLEYVNQGSLSRGALFNQVEASLKRLGTTYIDVLIIHRDDQNTPVEETMKALHDLVQSSKVRYIGASNVHLWEFSETNNVTDKNHWTKLEVLMYPGREVEMFACCKLKGIGILAYSPLMDGHFARPVDTKTECYNTFTGSPLDKPCRELDKDKEIIKWVEDIAKMRSWTMSQVALSWSLTKVLSLFVRTSSLERVHQAIVLEEGLTAEEIKYLEEP
ncbi:Aldo/keto reductase [Mycena albidolilacea]|uniref:Aldo/keto reductase n=1 Tax=Mycena albidolilacea TaxID=1033008 RepID=A0AAD7E8E0_9AGAR|nr:Aldo/keto reductase [Mycena albidolilacea]